MTRAVRVLPTAIVLAVGLALTAAAVAFRRSAAAPSVPSPSRAIDAGPAQESSAGVVCFGVVDLEHGVTSLSPLQPGRVAAVLVRENQTVAAGAELLRLEDGAARSRLAEAEAAVTLARLQVRQAQKLPEQHRNRVSQQQEMRAVMRSRLDAARHLLDQEKRMVQSKVISRAEMSSSEEKVREVEALERIEELRLAELNGQDVTVDIQRAESELQAAEARRDQARLAWEECRLKAPRPGTVLRILVGPGDVLGVQPGQPAVLFAAEDPQVIRATVEQEFAPRIREGGPALVQDEADSAAWWRGRVERIAGWYAQRRTVLHDPAQFSDVRTLECLIVLEPGQPRLRLGQSVRVFIGTRPR
ncbi:MAG TPA: HlyD family efflux transporter periplasmic adaptor subunit [Isosphaeraceae bacterium]|nr:HlyD family efflux transporter periplasmic adaptor subunit [Isosphaeraceae bacterium]